MDDREQQRKVTTAKKVCKRQAAVAKQRLLGVRRRPRKASFAKRNAITAKRTAKKQVGVAKRNATTAKKTAKKRAKVAEKRS